MPLPGPVAPNELVESAWGNLVVDNLTTHDSRIAANENAILYTPWAPAGSLTAPYVGGSGSGRVLWRGGHAAVTTNANGDSYISFQSAFPNGLFSLTVSGIGSSSMFWWPMIVNSYVGGFSFYAIAQFGWPGATGHPPGQPDVYTLPNRAVQINYVALGR